MKTKWDAKEFEYIEDWQSFDPCDVKQVDEKDLAYLCKCANEIEAQRDDRRERFAMAAMQGMLANSNPIIVDKIVSDAGAKDVREACRIIADALIAELDKEAGNE